MNKDIDNIDSTDKSVEKALDIMESSSEINVEQLQEMLKDEETLQACRDIMDSSLFLQQKSGMELPNIEMELERFKKKQYTARMRSNFWKVSMGSILNLISFQYPDDPCPGANHSIYCGCCPSTYHSAKR